MSYDEIAVLSVAGGQLSVAVASPAVVVSRLPAGQPGVADASAVTAVVVVSPVKESPAEWVMTHGSGVLSNTTLRNELSFRYEISAGLAWMKRTFEKCRSAWSLAATPMTW